MSCSSPPASRSSCMRCRSCWVGHRTPSFLQVFFIAVSEMPCPAQIAATKSFGLLPQAAVSSASSHSPGGRRLPGGRGCPAFFLGKTLIRLYMTREREKDRGALCRQGHQTRDSESRLHFVKGCAHLEKV
eukprot:759862-Hanusia_phi.AAC.1